jgi:hypothetical protein
MSVRSIAEPRTNFRTEGPQNEPPSGIRLWAAAVRLRPQETAGQRYGSQEAEPDGLRAMTALVVLREKVIRPLLASSQQPESQTKPNHPTSVDHHYEHLRVGMRDLFTALGMVA